MIPHHIPIRTKDPDARTRYAIRWHKYLGSEDTIVGSEWFVAEGDDALEIASNGYDDTSAYVWLTGGAVGRRYRITNRITTANSSIEDQSMYIQMIER